MRLPPRTLRVLVAMTGNLCHLACPVPKAKRSKIATIQDLQSKKSFCRVGWLSGSFTRLKEIHLSST